MMDQLNEAYNFMEHKTEGAACLVTLSTLPKIFSAGFDLKFMLKHKGTQKVEHYRNTFKALLAKLLKLPMITVNIGSIRLLRLMGMPMRLAWASHSYMIIES